MSFVVDVEDVENCRTVRNIYCRCCRKHVDKIRLDSRLRGQARSYYLMFAEGSTNIKKSAITSHNCVYGRFMIVNIRLVSC